MNHTKKLYIFFFPILILIIFLIDKIFLIEEVRDHFIQPGGMLYYRQRKEQLKILEDKIKKDKLNKENQIIIVLGDSRSFGIGTDLAKAIQLNDFSIWNFAGPQAVPAYYLFVAEKIFEYAKPDYFYIGISPDAFNRNSGIFAIPVLAYGVDESFIDKYKEFIPEKDFKRYQNTRKYALAGLQFSFKTLILRIKGTFFTKNLEEFLKNYNIQYDKLSLEEKKIFQTLYSFREEDLNFYVYKKSPQRTLLNYTQGAQYAWFGKMSDKELKKETEKIKNLYLNNFVISYEQILFLKFLLELIKNNNAKAILFFPKVNPYLLDLYKQTKAIQYIINQIIQLSEENHFPIVDFNQENLIQCNDFYDASHLSVSCFPDVLKILVQKHY